MAVRTVMNATLWGDVAPMKILVPAKPARKPAKKTTAKKTTKRKPKKATAKKGK